jgi:hypothetical protein
MASGMTGARYHEHASLSPMEPKRRLPVLKDAGGDGDAPRAPWQWVGFGALAIIAVWVPLTWLSLLAAVRVGEAPHAAAIAARLLVLAGGLAAGALAGGYLIGRWGTAGVGTREAALAALVAALAATALAWGTGGVSFGSLATVVVAVPPAALGARLGLRRRH